MGHRLSKIYTRTGDDGTTGLGDGTRVDKDDARVDAYGTVDELNSVIGMVLAQDLPAPVREPLTRIQHDLFDVGGELCIPGRNVIDDDRVRRLETVLEALNKNLPALKEFILPGGCPAAAVCHVARTVCRRTERRVISLSKLQQVNAATMKYLNRLSDLLFVMARFLNAQAGQPDVLWERGNGPR